jgi:hypothetical protein
MFLILFFSKIAAVIKSNETNLKYPKLINEVDIDPSK